MGTWEFIPRSKRVQSSQKNLELSHIETELTMPDTYGLGHRPLVRKLSATQNDLVKKVRTKAERNADLELKVVDWIESVLGERPYKSYESFIQDGRIISRVMTSIVFNSVPMEEIETTWGSQPQVARVKTVIREIKRYGVIDVFEAEDLLELKNIPKVTKCLAQLSKLAASDKDNLLNSF